MAFWAFVGAVDILNELIAALMFSGSVAFGYAGDIHVGVDTCCCSIIQRENQNQTITFIAFVGA